VRVRYLAVGAAAVVLAACSGGSGGSGGGSRPGVSWTVFRHLPGVVDLAGPRGDGSFLVAAAGRLGVLGRGGTLSAFARGAGGYRTATGPEPYIAVTSGVPVAGDHCSFGKNELFALEPGKQRPGVIMISPAGTARRFASLPAGRSLSGIAFDGTSVVAGGGPTMEGGIAVAPSGFGRFGGDLIAPDEGSGRVYAVEPSGRVATLAESGLPAGGDIGVESAGFVPAGASAAYLADRFSAGNKHPGDDAILRLDLARAGVRAGDLLVATEGGARTIDVRCRAACTIRVVAAGPDIAHAEGHIVFAAG
jgi:hypothetical protein